MHGFMFFLGPEWYGFGPAERRQHKLVDVWRGQRKRQPAPDEQEFEFLVVVTLVIALVINIALTVHFVG
jgi:hypothetical protein